MRRRPTLDCILVSAILAATCLCSSGPCLAAEGCGQEVAVMAWMPHQVVTILVDGIPHQLIISQGIPPGFILHKCDCVENDAEEFADDDCEYDSDEVPTDPGGTHTDVGCMFANSNYSESCQLASAQGCNE